MVSLPHQPFRKAQLYVGCYNNRIYALNSQTGGYIWSFATGDLVISHPAVSGDMVYVGGWDGKLYALSRSNGVLEWSFVSGGKVDSSPAVVNGIVYVGSHDGIVYALNASTGLLGYDWELHHSLIWSYNTGSMVMLSSPAVADGMVCVGALDGKVYALDASTGAFKWSYQTGYTIASSPAVANGMVYIGSEDNKTYALDASSGKLIWSFHRRNMIVTSSPAVCRRQSIYRLLRP